MVVVKADGYGRDAGIGAPVLAWLHAPTEDLTPTTPATR